MPVQAERELTFQVHHFDVLEQVVHDVVSRSHDLHKTDEVAHHLR